MSPQKQHVIHGRDHTANGSDPIPGIGAGGGALEWEDVGTSGAGVAVPNARFVSAYHTATSVPSGSEWAVPFAFDACVSNDDPADAGYQTTFGSYVSGSTWAGDYFLAPSTSGEAFKVKRSPGGLYAITASISMYVPTLHTVTVRVVLPNGSGSQGYGAVAPPSSWYSEGVAFGPGAAQRQWTRSWICVMDEAGGTTPQPCAMYVTQTTGAALTLGPPQFWIQAYRVTLN